MPTGYFFTSPSGNLSCGFYLEVGGRIDMVGCQAWSVVANLPDCDDPNRGSSPIVSLDTSGEVDTSCTSEGVFSATTAPVLNYGEQLTVAGFTCHSREVGITCVDNRTGEGFTASRARFGAIG